ncbi:MAG: [FeFe] hydrogenase H-cluster radical SAM maturase HydG [Bacteroidales bacterium]
MKFSPQKYAIPDYPGQPFIDHDEIAGLLNNVEVTTERIREVIEKSLGKNRLSLGETAVLLAAEKPEHIRMILEAARELKNRVYGNRIVLFAPLYVGSHCINNCKYCGFRASNKNALRKTLNKKELIAEVEALEDDGQKRLILVFGEHPQYNAQFIADTVRTVYGIKKGAGEIRRVNINAAPMDVKGFKTIHEAGIGTYQIFQETYHEETYKQYHPAGWKANYNRRLVALDDAFQAGIDDVGIGALFGLYDWKYEVLGLIRHVNHLEACFNVGPHTISFPRLKNASGIDTGKDYLVSDEDFIRLIAIIRLAVPYTGLILTARETAEIRQKVLAFGCSQIDAGTKIELGGYSSHSAQEQQIDHEQFQIGDDRPLGEVMSDLIQNGFLPSFCTACYRKGRTGEHFMEFSVPGFIKRFCTPNAILTLAEYLEDYATDETARQGWNLIKSELVKIEDDALRNKVLERLEAVKQGKRDLNF